MPGIGTPSTRPGHDDEHRATGGVVNPANARPIGEGGIDCVLQPGALPAHLLGDTTHRDRALAAEVLADRDHHRDQLRSLCRQLAAILGDDEPTDEPDALADRIADLVGAARAPHADYVRDRDRWKADAGKLRHALQELADSVGELQTQADAASRATQDRRAIDAYRAALDVLEATR